MADAPESGWCLEPDAEDLAASHHLSSRPPVEVQSWSHLAQAHDWLRRVRRACVDPPPEAAKAAEWLLDNDFQVHRALRQIRTDLPRSFYLRLPALAAPEDNGTPRIFAVAHEYLECSKLQVSLASAVRFTAAYQRKAPLTTAELWAFPTMLRIACIEILIATVTPLLGARIPLPFAPSRWSTEKHALEETERIARAIANLSLIAAIPWDEFFEQTSKVEEILRGDPSDVYATMDFDSRDRYRRAVEALAASSALDEASVAARAIARARAEPPGEAKAHVGYWLVGAGRPALERVIDARISRGDRMRRLALAHPGLIYAIGLAACGLGALLLPSLYLLASGASLLGWAAALLLSLIPASVLAITILNWAITRSLPPRTLCKLDFKRGLPADCRTLIAIPVVIADAAEVPGLAEQMETHWLSNPDPNVQVALLADLADAPDARLPGDEVIEQALRDEVRRLNRHYPSGGGGPFHLLLRPRRHNRAQGCWMAWERKRGKLEQLNRLLLEGEASGFSEHVGERAALDGIRFVMTVDADTLLPPGTVARLAGALAHPLNRACSDPATGRVTAGYSIIQPRVEISPQSGQRTPFARLFTGDTNIDIYSRAVSDVYQDLFGAGIFVGKGLYDLRAFHLSVDGCVPENAILSHDLFEGAHGRVALASDIILYEGFPNSYLDYGRRLHRWIRGDWQLLPWLSGRARRADGEPGPLRISGIDRWKVIDNLRRSLVPASLVLLAIGGWFVLPGSPWFWTLLVLLAPGGQLFTDLVSGLARGRRRGTVRGVLPNLSNQAGRWFLAIAYLLHEALLSLHAIGQTLWRLTVSRRRLLEWTSAAHVAASLKGRTGRPGIWRQLWLGPSLALATALLLAFVRPEALIPAAPLLLLWISAPEITLRIGRPRRIEAAPFTERDIAFLRLLARRTWFYFETFAGPEENWLPPDNYQDAPHAEIAHRTSPTNIGMMLLSTAAAWDLGFIGRAELAARFGNCFDSLARLERHRGHFFNWYDTRSLKPLEPRYISSVDSGNLAACLIACAATLREAGERSSLETQRWQGLEDAAGLLDGALARLPDAQPSRARLAAIVRRMSDARDSGAAEALDSIIGEDLPAFEAELVRFGSPASAPPAQAMREAYDWLERLSYQLRAVRRDLGEISSESETLIALADEAGALADAMDFGALYDAERRLLYIGHNASAGRTDPHHYDLLASEARIASFFAIAKGDVPPEHWFHLQRPVAAAGDGVALLSWNGSMFEYLMPRLLLRPAPETLLGESERMAVALQRRHGAGHDVPWGISESAYAERDPDHRYRYQAFGVPSLGLRRGLGRDMVVAPYASALALAVAPHAAADNLGRLASLGALRRFGFIEALDFTAERAGDAGFVPVTTYMAHHQGMILAGIANALLGDRFVERLEREPRMRVISLLLSERVPRLAPPEIERLEERDRPSAPVAAVTIPPPYEPPAGAPAPQAHLIGNGSLACWISDSGGGGLRWHRNAVTRFLADPTRDVEGLWIYIADEDNGALWSATRQPTARPASDYRAIFHPHMAEFHRREEQIHTSLEVAVASSADLEVRRLVLVNESDQARRLRLTSYGEVVLSPPLQDERHPAFSKLFVGGDPVSRLAGLLFTRRPRSPGETPPALLHYVVTADGPPREVMFEIDRARFVGRLGTLRDPQGARGELSGIGGWPLDPIMALQLRVDLAPYERREICFVTVAAASREGAIDIAERHATLASLDWALGDAAREAARAIERVRLEPERLPLLGMLASLLVYPAGQLAAGTDKLRLNRLGQPHLWGLAISGDLPILVARSGSGDRSLVRTLVSAHQLWRRHGLEIDLVILQTSGSAYAEPLRNDLADMLRSAGMSEMLGRGGGIHLVFADQIGPDQVALLEASARVLLDDREGDFAELAAKALAAPAELPHFLPSRPPDQHPPAAERAREPLLFDHGVGGFAADGRHYVIRLEAGRTTPAPWCNVLANEGFGCIVSEAGLGFSWALNSGENRLTPWSNDPVTDPAAEALYLRDEETAAVWSVTPSPAGRGDACEIRHGAGTTSWTRHSQGLAQEMLVLVPADAAVKLVRLRLANQLDRHRRLTVTYYAEWLLGTLQSRSREHVHCAFDAEARAIFARSAWNPDFAARVAFLGASERPHGFTTSRREFLGRDGDPSDPAALRRWGLGGTAESRDSCAALQVHLDLSPGETREILFVLGQGSDEADARALLATWASPDAAAKALATLEARWDDLLGAITVRTPDPAFDLLANRWLLYQGLSSRILARAGFYQAGGAIGFRDQLQDVLAFIHAEPRRARSHILLCAAHQFEAGDVLHWWHPPSERGVRTRFSDDLLWLPYAAASYVQATGDLSILEERVAFLSAAELGPEEEDRYARFDSGDAAWPLLAHCHRALERALKRGAHKLPLIGSGDWNDGMNRLGREGRGESVWLAWFAAVTCDLVADLNLRLGQQAIADHWKRSADELRRDAEQAGWDGSWYRRAYDDAGHAVGSAGSEECRIDSISQSWALFAGADPARAAAALAAAARELLDPEHALARLLWPPFDRAPGDPGYIKAYPPGIRENGGQYSHAAAWLGMALAQAGERGAAKAVFDMINPILRSRDAVAAELYRVEPYVVAADIATAGPQAGRGGWTWYTGSAAWTWRLAVESILGLRRVEGKLKIEPRLPPGWTGYEASLSGGKGSIALRVSDPNGLGAGRVMLRVDGKAFADDLVAFPDDGSVRQVEARLVA